MFLPHTNHIFTILVLPCLVCRLKKTYIKTTLFPASACGYDWTENPTTGECYRVEVMERIFKDARLHCHELHYEEGQTRPDLVSIASAQEETFVFSKC